VSVDNTHPLAYGMPPEALVLFHYSPAFDVIATDFNDRNQIVVRYAERNVERSGWLTARSTSRARRPWPRLASAREGRADRVPDAERAQTHGTYKFLFNALVSGPGR